MKLKKEKEIKLGFYNNLSKKHRELFNILTTFLTMVSANDSALGQVQDFYRYTSIEAPKSNLAISFALQLLCGHRKHFTAITPNTFLVPGFLSVKRLSKLYRRNVCLCLEKFAE